MIHTLKDAMHTSEQDAVRQPAVAGRFYPGEPAELQAAVQRLLAAVQPAHLGRVRALIAPHAGYACSGAVAAAAYRTLEPGAPAVSTRLPVVYMLGPAHWRPVDGVGLPRSTSFATPLGTVEVASDRVAHLLHLGGQYRLNEAAHVPEHALEVQLPFLQMTLGGFAIVPMLFDDGADPERMAIDLAAMLEGHTDDLVVVSSDLSHYQSYQQAIILDHSLLKAVATGNLAEANNGEACGLLPILCLMRVAQHFGWKPHLRAYANSGDTCGSQREVVGYGAVVFTGS